MNAKYLMTGAACVAAGVVVGFIAATFGAATTMAGLTADRDLTRDKLADQVRQAIDTGADLVKQARAAQAEAEAALEAVQPKQVKRSGD